MKYVRVYANCRDIANDYCGVCSSRKLMKNALSPASGHQACKSVLSVELGCIATPMRRNNK